MHDVSTWCMMECDAMHKLLQLQTKAKASGTMHRFVPGLNGFFLYARARCARSQLCLTNIP